MRIVIAILALLIAAPTWAATTAAPAPKTETCKMNIEGMTCISCSMKVKEALSTLCANAVIDAKTGTGTCSYLSGTTTPDAIVKRVNETGFKATLTK